MSYDLFVSIPAVTDSVVPLWLEKLKELKTECEIHPEFSFDNQTGFLPFKVFVHDNPNYGSAPLISGFELSVTDYEANPIQYFYTIEGSEVEYLEDEVRVMKKMNKLPHRRSFLDKIVGRNKEPKLIKHKTNLPKELLTAKKQLIFSCSSQDMLEYRMTWYSASILAKLLNGVVEDPQSEGYISGEKVIEKAVKLVKAFESSVPGNKYSLHPFEGWS